jgi:hypothetical protein
MITAGEPIDENLGERLAEMGVLAFFEPTLKSMIFDHAGPRDLAEGMPLRDKHMVYPHEARRGDAQRRPSSIDYGVNEPASSSSECKLEKFQLTPREGGDGRRGVQRAAAEPDRAQARAAFLYLLQEQRDHHHGRSPRTPDELPDHERESSVSVASVVDWATRRNALDEARPVRMEFDGRLSPDEQRMVRDNIMKAMASIPPKPIEVLIAEAVTQALQTRLPSIARVGLSTRRYGLAPIAALIYGYTEIAVNKKMDSGVWRRNHEWILAPDGRRFIDFDAVDAWVAQEHPRDQQ